MALNTWLMDHPFNMYIYTPPLLDIQGEGVKKIPITSYFGVLISEKKGGSYLKGS